MRPAQLTRLTVISSLVGGVSLFAALVVDLGLIEPLEQEICTVGTTTPDPVHRVHVSLSYERLSVCDRERSSFYVTPEIARRLSAYYYVLAAFFIVMLVAVAIPPLVRRSQRQWREY